MTNDYLKKLEEQNEELTKVIEDQAKRIPHNDLVYCVELSAHYVEQNEGRSTFPVIFRDVICWSITDRSLDELKTFTRNFFKQQEMDIESTEVSLCRSLVQGVPKLEDKTDRSVIWQDNSFCVKVVLNMLYPFSDWM